MANENLHSKILVVSVLVSSFNVYDQNSLPSQKSKDSQTKVSGGGDTGGGKIGAVGNYIPELTEGHVRLAVQKSQYELLPLLNSLPIYLLKEIWNWSMPSNREHNPKQVDKLKAFLQLFIENDNEKNNTYCFSS